MYKNKIKPLFDWVTAFFAFIVLLPLTVLILVILIVLNNGKPFFFQPRPGLNQMIFKVIKFRTMTDKKDINGHLLPNELRVTKIGSVIRKLSLDELPQLFNVLKGDMSIVGPRPLKVDYLNLYSLEQIKRHDVKPGITGYAQVRGRNSISHTEKFKLDIFYVNNLSFILDMKILIATASKFFNKKEIENAMINLNEPFNGNN
jgi:undecaprenyl phosphate N,N'-diacetylbacillosamine 1-phosphate transferase